MKHLRSLALAASLILLPVLAIFAFAGFGSAGLAEATVDVGGKQVRFALHGSGSSVYASVDFDRDLIHYRRSTRKSVPGATADAARYAGFEFDKQKRQGRFLMEGATVIFEPKSDGSWHILPVREALN